MAHSPDPGALDKFRATFVAPLLASKHEALQALFYADLNPVAMALNFDGLELDAPSPLFRACFSVCRRALFSLWSFIVLL
jgi:hypothetical protein